MGASGRAARKDAEQHVIRVDGLTHGAEAVGRLPSGKACFVPFAIPGETVRIEVTEVRKRWARGRLLEVVEASGDRVRAPCPYFGPQDPDGPARCGGCALQHVSAPRQAQMKERIVTEQLERIGGFTDPPVEPTVSVATYGYRQRTRFGVVEGRLGYRRQRSNAIVPIDVCALLSPDTQALRDEAGDSWRGADEVAVSTGDQGGMIVVTPGSAGLPPLPEGEVPVALRSPGGAAALRGDPQVIHRVCGFDLRVSASSFFQTSSAAAEAMAELVRRAAGVGVEDAVCDLYAGVGLFSRVLAAQGATVTAVESHPAAAEDARHNLAGLDDAEVLQTDVETQLREWTATGRWFDVIVLDPPRRGAGPDVARVLAAMEPRRLIYVSCDPAALARDARALADAGLALVSATPVDQFAQTAAIEIVALFAPPEDAA